MQKNFFKVVVYDTNVVLTMNEATKCSVKQAKDVYGNLAHLLAQAMDVSFEEFRNDTGGVRSPDGNWTGVIGMLNRSEADIAVVPLYITEERSQAIDYSYPFIVNEVSFVTKKPEFIPNIFGIFHVFDENVWLALGISMIVIMFMNCISQWKKYGCVEVILDVLTTILKQSSSINTESDVGKLVNISWLINGTFLSMFYSSVLLSFLSFPVLKGVRTVPQLAKAVEGGSLQCSTLAGSGTAHLLSSGNNITKLIGDNIEKNPDGYSNINGFINRSSQSNIAYIHSRHILNVLKDNYLVSNDNFLLIFGAIAMRKNFCCKLDLDKSIRAINEAGLYQKLLNDDNFVTRLSLLRIENTEVKYPKKLSVYDIGGALIILAVGYFVSLLVFLVELFASTG